MDEMITNPLEIRMDLDKGQCEFPYQNIEKAINLLLCDETFDLSPDLLSNENFQESKQPELWSPQYENFIIEEQRKEHFYHPPIINTQQFPNVVTNHMRAILIDWIVKICADQNFKRETLHNSISHLDRIICKDPEITTANFQLYGLVILYLSAKTIEARVPEISIFIMYAEDLYNVAWFKKIELRILRLLEWKLYPPTRLNILTCILKEWDSFIIKNYQAYNFVNAIDLENQEVSKKLIIFMENNKISFKRYLKTMQVLDIASLDYRINRFSPSNFVAGLVYIMIFKFFEESNYRLFKDSSISENDPNDYIYDYQEHCGNMILSFLEKTLAITSMSMLEEPLSFIQPYIRMAQRLPKFDLNKINAPFNEILSIQTMNSTAFRSYSHAQSNN
ncbi:hypothetical protein SteCoe_12892 [Stentor coeruleus]|uniref:Cyclin-like domain-containing protein n=1 Tax=Stentor coeruleus TaxID=5963 RepID=A0A1R2C9L2_9CILI|nr:hypothetical protein SteCoe_12892 [Stentor coeruleus]